MNGKSKANKFAAHAINESMPLHLRSYSVYISIRESGILSLPHPSTLANIKRIFIKRPGGDPSTYLNFSADVKSSEVDIIG